MAEAAAEICQNHVTDNTLRWYDTEVIEPTEGSVGLTMDSLLVDLDKVLDDFEAEENEAPGNERKPSGFHEFLEKSNEQTYKVIDNYIPASEIKQSDRNSLPQKADNLQNICYDFPYEPENFDLSEADFAPSPNLGDSGYNGSLTYSDNDGKTLNKALIKGTSTGDQSVSSSIVEGYKGKQQYENDVTNKNIMTHESNVIKNDIQPGKFKLTHPIQADNSPNEDRVFHNGEMNGYGHYEWTDSLLPKQNNTEYNQEQPPVRQVSVQSFVSTDSKSSDADKYPVQCNTPQTPKENMLLNPLDSQISSSNTEENCGAPNNSSHDSMQDNSDLDPKLAHLKNDIAGSLAGELASDVVTDRKLLLNTSNSLPATLYANLNGHDERQTSLPMDLSNSDINRHVSKDDSVQLNREADSRKELSKTTSLAKQGRENVSEHTVAIRNGRESEPSDSKEEQHVVGFGRVDEDMEESHMDDYLRDVEMSDQTVTDTRAYTLNNNDFMDGLDDKNSSSLERKQKSQLNEEKDEMINVPDKQQCQPLSSVQSDFSFVTNKADSFNMDALSEKSDIRQPVLLDPDYNHLTNPAADVIQVLPVELNSASSAITNSKPVISNLDTNLSPMGLFSIDSGLASLNDNVTDSGSFPSPVTEVPSDAGARPKDTNNMINRKGIMKDFGTVNVDEDSTLDLKPSVVSPTTDDYIRSDESPKLENIIQEELILPNQNELRQKMDNCDQVVQQTKTVEHMDTSVRSESNEENLNTGFVSDTDVDNVEMRMRRPVSPKGDPGRAVSGRPRSWSPSESGQPLVQKQKRPTSLNLPPLPQINLSERSDQEEDSNIVDPVEPETRENENAVNEVSNTVSEEDVENDGSLEGAVGGEEIPVIPPDSSEDLGPPPSYSSTLGVVAPKWIPDADAPSCMSCDAKFTFTKRRHHCRACGKVFCSACCNMKARLVHLKNQEARVCMMCHRELSNYERTQVEGAPRGPHPNNPGDYCSVVPPQQGATSAQPPPPSVLVPVLKRDGNGNGSVREEGGNRRAEPKQVMFSDGIRPGGDLTELDGSSEITRLPPRRTRVQKRVERVNSGGQHSSRSRQIRTMAERSLESLIPAEGLPPMLVLKQDGIGYEMQKNPDPAIFMTNIKDEQSPPVIFTINPNLHVLVKIINLDCCVNRIVWCITTRGMTNVGQEEIVTVLETLPDEATIPRDIFTHLSTVFEDASKGNPVTELGHTIFNKSFLDNRDHGGFLYIRSTFQCTQKLILPNPPYLFGILLQKWETPWAKVFPIRLLLRLGAEYRYYPCPLIGVRNRKPVFFEIGHTIMNLLADFRNYQYMLPSIKGITIHMEDKVTRINFPRNTYDDLMKVVNNSNEHVMAVAANFSPDADSHLVCIQNDDGNYQTQAINIQNKPRKVTGASFVVFNGALKTSSGLTAKSSIVEDGLMVQITPDSMLALKQSMKDMRDYTITCAVIGSPKPDETVIVQWIEDDKNVNIGVKSPIDGMSMDGVESLRIQNSVDYMGDRHCIRWTEIFFIQTREGGPVKWEPVDLSRLGETLATAFCLALTPHLQNLIDAGLTKIGLRVTLGADNVGYEAGSCEARLPDVYMNDLDNELIPVIHRAIQADGCMVLEMIFQVLE